LQQGLDCDAVYDTVCAQAVDTFPGLDADFDIGALLANCPEACSDGEPVCLPPPPAPSPPSPPLSPPAPFMPVTRCADDPSYRDAGWVCADWSGRDCHEAFGVSVDRLLSSCPETCGSAACSPPPSTPPPPSPPPGVKWCVSYAFGEYVVGVTVAALLCSLAALLALACLRRTRPHLSSPLLPAKRRRYSGLITWLLLITAPVMGWLFAVAPYAICYSSPVAAVVGLALWLLVSFAMGVAALGVAPTLGPFAPRRGVSLP